MKFITAFDLDHKSIRNHLSSYKATCNSQGALISNESVFRTNAISLVTMLLRKKKGKGLSNNKQIITTIIRKPMAQDL